MMIFMVFFTETKNGKTQRLMSGNFFAGNHKEAIIKACKIIGYPIHFDEKLYVENKDYEFTRSVPGEVDRTGEFPIQNHDLLTYTIKTCPVDCMITTYDVRAA